MMTLETVDRLATSWRHSTTESASPLASQCAHGIPCTLCGHHGSAAERQNPREQRNPAARAGFAARWEGFEPPAA